MAEQNIWSRWMMLLKRRQEERMHPRRLLCFSAAFCAVLFVLSLGFCAGLRYVPAVVFAVCLAAAGVLWWFWGRRYLLVAIGLLLGVIYFVLFQTVAYRPAVQFDGFSGEVALEVSEYAQAQNGYGTVEGTIRSLNGRKVRLHATVYLQDASPHYAPGDTLTFDGRIQSAPLDAQKRMVQEGIFLKVSQQGEAEVQTPERLPLKHWPRVFAHQVAERILLLVDGDEGGLLTALLTGDKSQYSHSFREALSSSGVSHITAVSGMHVSILAAFVIALFGRKWGSLAAIPLLVVFGAMTGFPPSVVRALLMTGAVIAGFLLRREADVLTSLSGALLVLLMLNPFSSLSASLLLSFAATLGIVLFAPMLLTTLQRGLHLEQRIKSGGRRLKWVQGLFRGGVKLANYVLACLATSVSALVFTMPISMLFFSRVSVISLLTNVLILWAVSLVMVLGIGMLVLSQVWMPLGAAVAQLIVEPLLSGMVTVICGVAKLPFAAASSGNLYLILVALAMLAVFCVVRIRRQLAAGGISALLALCLICFGFAGVEGRLYAEVSIWGGDGNAIVLYTGRCGSFAVNTASENGNGAYFLSDRLYASSRPILDTVVLTANDYQQTGGVAPLSETVDMKRLILPQEGLEKPTTASDIRSLQDDGCEVLCYNKEGTMTLVGCSVELYQTGSTGEDIQYASRLDAGGLKVLNLSGLFPLDGLQVSVKQRLTADVLIIDQPYGNAAPALRQICSQVRPSLVLVADTFYSEQIDLEQVCGVKTVSLTNEGPVTIKVMGR